MNKLTVLSPKLSKSLIQTARPDRPLIPYSRQFIDESDIQSVESSLRSNHLTQGPKIAEFESKLCKITGARYAVAVNSGTSALHIACMAAGISPGDEVITSPISFVASANCVLYCGGTPVFADIKLENGNIDPGKIETRLSARTRAIIPVHYAGIPCDITKIKSIAKQKNLVVIEDASHALGAEYKVGGHWVKVGSCQHSDMSIFSFHAVKNITTGEGGAVTTNSEKLRDKLILFRSHGICRDEDTQKVGSWYYEMRALGFNYRITDFQCALGISQLGKLGRFIKQRNEIARLYKENLSDLNEIEHQFQPSNFRYAWHLYPVKIKTIQDLRSKKRIVDALKSLGVAVQVHYIPIYLHPYYQKRFQLKTGYCKSAEEFYLKALSLPMHCNLNKRDIEKICQALRKVLRCQQ